MIAWFRDRRILLISILFSLVFLSLTLLAGLGHWSLGGLLLLGLATVASTGVLILALLRTVRVPPRNWGPQMRQREKEVQQAREQILQLTLELRRKSGQLTTDRDQAEFLRESFGELASSLEPRHVFQGILERAINAAQARWGSILLLDEHGRPAEAFLSGEGGPAPSQGPSTTILNWGFADWVMDNRRADIIFDTNQDSRWLAFPGDEAPARSAVAVPFLRRERVLGAMVLTHPFPFQFSETHLTLLQELAQQAAVCLENADLYAAAEGERRKLAAILQGTTDAIIVVDRRGSVLLLNQAAERAFLVSAKTALGQPLSTAVAHPALVELFTRALSSNEAVTGELTTVDERSRYCSISLIPEVGWVAILQDITYLKELDRLKGEFVSTVSHDLRSPLTSVRGYADLIAVMGPVTQEQHEALQKISRAVGQMNDLIGDLLDLGKIEAGIDMGMAPCALGDIVAQVVDSSVSNALQKGLDLQAEIAEELPEIVGNAGRLRQVVANLVDNAIKYTSKGTVRVRLVQHDGEIVLSVTDTGMGIAPQDQEQLFQKFYRVRTPQTEGVAGTGLGLAIVRSIVEQHGGRIWVRSAPGQGSTFTVALPIPESQPQQ